MYPGRTNATLMAGVMEIDPTITDLSPFIDVANEMVTEYCAVNSTTTPIVNIYGYSDHRLELIETLLACHFLNGRDTKTQQEGAGTVQQTTPIKLDLGFSNSYWGQQALLLDTAGGLALLQNGQKKWAKIPKSIGQSINVGATWLSRKNKTHSHGGDHA